MSKIQVFSLLLLFLPLLLAALSSQCFDVTQYGAVGDGVTDDTQAFEDAWKAACGASDSPTVLVPKGMTFLLQPVVFSGDRCNFVTVTFLISGTITAPSNISEWACDLENCRHWIEFDRVTGLRISGYGLVDGKGQRWWDLPCNADHDCARKPTAFVLNHCNKVHLSQLTFVNSPQMHLALETSTLVHITGITVASPANSPNTDGIHIQHSRHVSIDSVKVGTGDDCVSIGDGTAYLKITNMHCGPGHGISIGSLGKNNKFETVENVHVSDVTLSETTNGIRIKTWQGGSGFVRNISFDRIITKGSALPIVIDQFYSPHTKSDDKASAVQISDVTYNDIQGLSHKATAIKLACSYSSPCTNIVVNNVNIKMTDEGGETASYCLNVQGKQSGDAVPLISCLDLAN